MKSEIFVREYKTHRPTKHAAWWWISGGGGGSGLTTRGPDWNSYVSASTCWHIIVL